MKHALALASLLFLACEDEAKPESDSARPSNASSTSAKSTRSITSGSAVAPSSAATTAASASASAAARPQDRCEQLGCKGEGTFDRKCDCSGKAATPPLVAKFRGTFSAIGADFDVENTSEEPISWASGAVYYYDAQGKQLGRDDKGKKTLAYRFNRTTDTGAINTKQLELDPEEKEEDTSFGWSDKDVPGAKDVVIVFNGWCLGKAPSQFCVVTDLGPEERPK